MQPQQIVLHVTYHRSLVVYILDLRETPAATREAVRLSDSASRLCVSGSGFDSILPGGAAFFSA